MDRVEKGDTERVKRGSVTGDKKKVDHVNVGRRKGVMKGENWSKTWCQCTCNHTCKLKKKQRDTH